jgi:hypothetical protein
MPILTNDMTTNSDYVVFNHQDVDCNSVLDGSQRIR